MLLSLELIYRTERHFRRLGAATSLLGAVAIWTGYSAPGGVLMFLSVLCQLISWRAMRAAQRAHDARTQRAVL